jgi:hypothetical protein
MNAIRDGSDRVTQAFWHAPRGQGSINRLVFTRDVPLGLVPIGGHSDMNPNFAVRADGDAAVGQAIVSFLGREQSHGWLAEAVCDFIEEVAKLLAEDGDAYYELVSGPAPVAAGPGGAAARPAFERHLEMIPPRSLHRLWPIAVQAVPRDAPAARRLIRVPKNKFFRIKLPQSLGTPRSHRRMLRRLDRVEQASRSFITVTAPTSPPKGYDYRAAQRASESEVVRLTRQWGILTFLEPKDMTPYFSIAGALCHRRAQAILRDHIVDRLNAILRAQGLAEVRLEGLPAVADVERTLAELAAGTIDLKQAVEAVRLI